MFNLEQALAESTRRLAERAKTRTTAYTLYFSNDGKRYEGKIDGVTIKQLINEFRVSKATYKYAFITKMNDGKVLRFYNRDSGKKFYSMTRTGGKRTPKVK